MHAVEIQNLEWKYANTREFALKGVSLTIEQNRFIGIVGPNEMGKTTLVSAIRGLIPHSINGVYRGAVKVLGREVRTAPSIDLAALIGFVFADPESQFTAMTVEEELVFGMENLGYTTAEIAERLDWVTRIAMLDDLLDKSPYDISGGQKQRVAIASVLAMNPPVLILDEPTSMIDPLGKDLIFDILRQLKEEGDRTIIVVEHNVEQLAQLADEMILVYDGAVLRHAPTREFFNDPGFLSAHDVDVPQVTALGARLRAAGWLPPETPLPLTIDELYEAVGPRLITSTEAPR
ncbi:MAG: energy-coupling factor ABC transporter ATP-binding protein [Ardenticatenaceae bacterium]|nr:energy-coupling factor ABC transporter ATP-binding protein [Ardenticatenaceae bacterium]HBY98477.1 ABC transporter ATP-binding protein [Chloroflexota bacterium]